MRLARFLTFALVTAPAFSQNWNAGLAEQYLDSRQKDWIAWPTAMHSGVACVSCHTGLPYLISRPILRQSLGEKSGPTLYERVLVASMRATVIRTDANDLFAGLKGPIVDEVYGAQVVLSSLVLAMDDASRATLTPEGEKSFERLWSLQVTTGPDKGAWLWSDFDLDPWETKESAYYGAALGALATGLAPADYQSRPEIQQNLAALKSYLRDGLKTQSLHNRLFVLWASAKLRGLLTPVEKQAILDELWSKQESDGGWTMQSFGPWKKREAAPVSIGSNSYATALAAFTTEQAGVKPSQRGLSQAPRSV
jgi:squalene-hopene/tetraprenyl-beta-curcumene cyclase